VRHVDVINDRKLESGKLVLVGRDVHLQPNCMKVHQIGSNLMGNITLIL
jgi:hypothetical protein